MTRTLTHTLAAALIALSLVAAWPGRARAADGQQVAQSILNDIHQATWITDGHGPHVVYIFFDPNCPYCHRLYVETRSWVKRGALQVRWIPIGVLTTTSAGKAAALLSAKDRLAALRQNEDHYKRGDGGGGIAENLLAPDRVYRELKANLALLSRTGSANVPVMLFETDEGGPLLIVGAPPPARLDFFLKHVK